MGDIPLIHLRTPREASRAFAEDVASGLLQEADAATDHACRLLRGLRAAGLPREKRDALRDLILDAFGDVQGHIDRTLDNEGVEFDRHQIDLSELTGANT